MRMLGLNPKKQKQSGSPNFGVIFISHLSGIPSGDSAVAADLAAASASAAALASPRRLLRATPERKVILAQRRWSGTEDGQR